MTPDELLEFLKDYKLSTRDFADVIGVTHQAVDHWIYARRDIPETVIRLIGMFDSSPPGTMENFKGYGTK